MARVLSFVCRVLVNIPKSFTCTCVCERVCVIVCVWISVGVSVCECECGWVGVWRCIARLEIGSME